MKWFIFAYIFQSILKESKGRRLETGTETESMEEQCLLPHCSDCLVSFILQAGPTYLGMAPPVAG